MVAPPFEAGAVNVSEIDVVLTTVAEPIVGAPGTVIPPPALVTEIVIFVRVVFCEFAADTTYVADVAVTVGVPEIVPFVALNKSPDGRLGEMDQVVTAPPEFEAVTDVIADPTVPLIVVAE